MLLNFFNISIKFFILVLSVDFTNNTQTNTYLKFLHSRVLLLIFFKLYYTRTYFVPYFLPYAE